MGSIVTNSTDYCNPVNIILYIRVFDWIYGYLSRCQSYVRPFISISCKWAYDLIQPPWAQKKKTTQTIFFYFIIVLQEIHVTDSGGRSVILSFVLNAFIGALILRFIVGRTKLCLDFSCTYHFIHLIVCWIYNGSFPSTFSWWFLNAACATLMCVFGEFLCLKIELKEIPVGYIPLDTKADL